MGRRDRRGWTTIEVRVETRDMLKEMGKKGDTYDAIIRRLIERCKGAGRGGEKLQ